MIGTRPSFLWRYLSSIRSVTHGWTGVGSRKMPCEPGRQPVAAVGITAAASSQSLRRIQDMLPPPCEPVRPPLLDVSDVGKAVFSVLWLVLRLLRTPGPAGVW